MSWMLKVPGLRILARAVEYISRPAPLHEFDDYDGYWKARAEDGQVSREMNRFKVIARLIAKSASVLDIGCGDCSFQQHLLRARPDCKSHGLDTSGMAVQLAHQKGCSAQVINHALPLKEQVEGHWDVVTLMEVIEHIVDAEELMRQVMELSPRRIFVTVPNVGCLKHRLRLMFGSRFPITSIIYHMREHVRFWTVKDFVQWADALGLAVESVHAQFDRGDAIVGWCVNRYPSLFASQVVYQLRPVR